MRIFGALCILTLCVCVFSVFPTGFMCYLCVIVTIKHEEDKIVPIGL